MGRSGLLPARTVAVVTTTLGYSCVCKLPSNLFHWASDGTDEGLFRAVSDLC